ncbi:MAG: hypothetical protein WAW37_15255 [Syntrophobacteraceae bacterium]
MVFSFCEDANFSKQLKALGRRGGNAAAAAEHARAIVSQVIDGGTSSPRRMGRLTRNGEARIKDSVKFDLVGGYRLIGVMRGREITFLFIGSHDECERWIRNNAGLESLPDKRRNRRVEIRENHPTVAPPAQGPPQAVAEESDYDRELLENLTERDLRRIFRGLCGK